MNGRYGNTRVMEKEVENYLWRQNEVYFQCSRQYPECASPLTIKIKATPQILRMWQVSPNRSQQCDRKHPFMTSFCNKNTYYYYYRNNFDCHFPQCNHTCTYILQHVRWPQLATVVLCSPEQTALHRDSPPVQQQALSRRQVQ